MTSDSSRLRGPELYDPEINRYHLDGRPQRTLSSPLPPETQVDCQRFILQRRSMHFNWALAVSKYVPAPYPQPVTIGTHELIEGAFTQCEHHPSDAAPEYGAAAHGAGLGSSASRRAKGRAPLYPADRWAHLVAHFEFTRINIEPIILRKRSEDSS